MHRMTIPKPPPTPEERDHRPEEEIERQQRTPEDDPMTGEDMGPETRGSDDARGESVETGEEASGD
jgi:hypothetical protein